MNSIGLRLKEVREWLSLTQKEMANLLGLKSHVQVGRFEKGINEPSFERLNKLAERYDIDLNWLITGKGNHPFKQTISASLYDIDRYILANHITTAALELHRASLMANDRDKKKYRDMGIELLKDAEKCTKKCERG